MGAKGKGAADAHSGVPAVLAIRFSNPSALPKETASLRHTFPEKPSPTRSCQTHNAQKLVLTCHPDVVQECRLLLLLGIDGFYC